MMTFKPHLKKLKNPNNHMIEYDTENLKDPKILQAFQTKICGRFAPLTNLGAEETYTDFFIAAISVGMTETASKILGKQRYAKKH